MLTKSGLSLFTGCCVFLAVTVYAFSQDDLNGGRSPESSLETHVFYLKNQPVSFVEDTLRLAMPDRTDLIIAKNEASNVLILRGSGESLESCAKILEILDQPIRMVYFDIAISVIEPGAAGAGGNEPTALDHLQLSTLDENQAKLQFGQQVAIVTGTVQSARGEATRSFQRQQTGTMIVVTPRIAGDAIAADLQIEKSWIEPPSADAAKANNPQVINTSQVQTTLLLQPGVAQTLRAKVSSSGNEAIEVSIKISASLEPPQTP